MIKIGIRHNLVYPMMLTTFTFLRNVGCILMRRQLKFKGPVVLTLTMFLSEFISGFILYKYQIKHSKAKSSLMGIRIKQNFSDKSNSTDITIYIILFSVALFDFIEFIITNNYFPKLDYESNSLDVRLHNLSTLFSAFFYHFLLKSNILKHQKLSLLVILFCLIIIMILEFFYSVIIKEYIFKNFFEVIFLMLVNYSLFSLMDVSEKFLLEKTNINPFQMLMIEGIFGLIFTSIFSFFENPFEEIKDFYNDNKDNNKFIYLILFLLIYFLFTAGKNVYRISTNILYTPMTLILTDSIMDPLLIIYYHFWENDLHNIFWFIINLIISFTMVFFGFVFNDFLVLYCCNLEHETYYEISKRAAKKENDKVNADIEISITDEYLIYLERDNDSNKQTNLFNL